MVFQKQVYPKREILLKVLGEILKSKLIFSLESDEFEALNFYCDYFFIEKKKRIMFIYLYLLSIGIMDT